MNELGLTIRQKKLVPPSIQIMCLGVFIDTVHGTTAIPTDMLPDITETKCQWLSWDIASKRQLESILGLLLYIYICNIKYVTAGTLTLWSDVYKSLMYNVAENRYRL